MKQKRSKKIEAQLVAEAYQGHFSSEKVLYLKEAKRLKDFGFTVKRVFSDKFDHPERFSFLYNISWENPEDEESFAKSLSDIASKI